MTRQDEIDRDVIGNCVGLRFLVLDELHTYRGRQGADVALLVRRVRERLVAGAAPVHRHVRDHGERGFARGQEPSRRRGRVEAVLGEHSREQRHRRDARARDRPVCRMPRRSSPKLGPAIDAGIPAINLRRCTCGTIRSRSGSRRGSASRGRTSTNAGCAPGRSTVTEAVKQLSEDSGRSVGRCRTALRDLLLVSSVPERSGRATRVRVRAASSRSSSTSSSRAPATRTRRSSRRADGVVTVEGQQFLPGDPEKRLYAIHFCRECGHEYHPVRFSPTIGSGRMFLARDIDDALPVPAGDDDDGKVG